jgi:hypothetical protein
VLLYAAGVALGLPPQAPIPPQAPCAPAESRPAPKTSPCSPACTCGCNAGGPCDCGTPRAVSGPPAAYFAPPAQRYDAQPPFYAAPAGGCAGGSCGAAPAGRGLFRRR